MDVLNDDYYMGLALDLARGTSGQTGINPAVGCVIVKEGRIIGLGAHLRRGTAHAEVHALNMAGADAEGATVYVTLEPCSHYGKTPPCAEKLVAEKVARVVVAASDPNPRVAGRGIDRLRENGIEVVTGVRESEARDLNEAFNKYIVTGMPFVTLKTASTLDGRIASRTGDSKWITNPHSREYVHLLRHRHQAVMTGSGTVLADDPELTTRLSVPGLQPVRVIVDSALRLPPEARLLAADSGGPVLVLTRAGANPERAKRLEALGAEIIPIEGAGPQVDLTAGLKVLGEREIGSILLEGGGRLNGAMLERRLIDKIVLFFAPKIIGGSDAPASFAFDGFERMDEAIRLTRTSVELFGEDICLTGYPDFRL
ncbi:bifunctional diaminohydroxyphosphoribosylaminopyrimidine deaminase/5-amino-6-(5-phosphoribosylamino)uracil reductase RibD [Gorillibacterium timonense]|uniref:bifunctional diaminohydroxyphosphoribosylaminopyrimidine deaminase/5-amino-6-(5-phosphoribosylamino)uracil reductase RibD n=1 Tax=Gorillibacterium timonense TaxID=1689269 RepID=UPI000AF85FD4|nr:bifunctional diaminohydroxyphosphoribosylaminopyrimidine deaminase/5-amino-6-(5-phosphoribosylamino)uracil reductase RibD [Gorillibacterium timonense]